MQGKWAPGQVSFISAQNRLMISLGLSHFKSRWYMSLLSIFPQAKLNAIGI